MADTTTKRSKGHADPCVQCGQKIRANQYAWRLVRHGFKDVYPLHYGCAPLVRGADHAVECGDCEGDGCGACDGTGIIPTASDRETP